MSEATNLELFRSKLALFIEYKWNMNYRYVLALGLIYILYACLLIMDCYLAENTAAKYVMLSYSLLIYLLKCSNFIHMELKNISVIFEITLIS